MRVLHVFKTYMTDSNGGIEKAIQQICIATAKQGIQNTIFSLTSGTEPVVTQLPEAEVYRFPISFECASTPVSWQGVKAFKKLVAAADVVHYHFPWPFADVLHFLVPSQKAHIITYHSDIVRQKLALKFYRPLMRHFLSQMDKVVATSPQYLQTSSVLQALQNKTQVIPIGLDKSTYPEPSTEHVNYWQKRVGKDFFLFVGVMRYYKGLSILLAACKNSSFSVVIVGSGPMELELKMQAEHLGLKNIHFVGAVDDSDKVALFKLCLAVLFPSHLRAEAFGISLLEGAMYGKPLISAEIGTGTCHINNHGETGLIVKAGDPIALREAMEWMLSHPAEISKMGIAAEARYWKYFTADFMAQQYQCLYENICRSKYA